jgi:hypothetical protein
MQEYNISQSEEQGPVENKRKKRMNEDKCSDILRKSKKNMGEKGEREKGGKRERKGDCFSEICGGQPQFCGPFPKVLMGLVLRHEEGSIPS